MVKNPRIFLQFKVLQLICRQTKLVWQITNHLELIHLNYHCVLHLVDIYPNK